MSNQHSPQATSSLAMWLNYLENIHTSAIDLGLERVEAVAKYAELTHPAPTVITVAGTNGKGSTCAIMEAILLDAGYSVGVYSSPHLIHYNERVRINGQSLADDKHTQALDFINKQRGETSLSFFEFSTLSALHLFKQHQVQVVLLEVGLGGRLDATNVVEHDVAVVTSIAIDHVDWLGDDIKQIGFEKAGIFRTDKPAICGEPHAPSTIAAYADKIGANFHQVGSDFHYQVMEDKWYWHSNTARLDDLPLPKLPLPNAATALAALKSAQLELANINFVNGLNQACLAGRMQQLNRDGTVVILDVAHNPHSAVYLIEQLRKCYPKYTFKAVLGMLKDKDIEQTIAIVEPHFSHFYLVDLQGPRAASATELASYVAGSYSLHTSPVDGFEQALQEAQVSEVVVVMGSFFTVGEILNDWESKK